MQQPVDALGHEARLPAPDRRFAVAGLPLIGIVPTPVALSSTMRARHTCFCGLLPNPARASSRSGAPGRMNVRYRKSNCGMELRSHAVTKISALRAISSSGPPRLSC